MGSGQFRLHLRPFLRYGVFSVLHTSPMTSLVVLIVVQYLSVLVMVLSLWGVNSSLEFALVGSNMELFPLYSVVYGAPWKGIQVLHVAGKSSQQQHEVDARESLNPMDKEDEEYEKHSDFIQRVNKPPSFRYLANEKKLFSLLTAYDTTPPPKQHCSSIQGTDCCYLSSIDAISYLQTHNNSLLIHCKDNRTLSHCQQYYLFRYDTRNQLCEPFYRKPCG